jgi:hypothetical protein
MPEAIGFLPYFPLGVQEDKVVVEGLVIKLNLKELSPRSFGISPHPLYPNYVYRFG